MSLCLNYILYGHRKRVQIPWGEDKLIQTVKLAENLHETFLNISISQAIFETAFCENPQTSFT